MTEILEVEAVEEAGNIMITHGMRMLMLARLPYRRTHVNRFRINLMDREMNAVVVMAVVLAVGPMVANRAADSLGR